jgi:AAA family ATP:ADP antiporter
MSIGESLRYLGSSKYMLALAALTICYGASINLVEVVWKSKLKLYCATPNEYSAFMGKFSTVTGAVTICMVLFVSRIFLSRGWGVAAIVTPIVLAITGLAFFAVILFEDASMGILAALGTTPLVFAVMAGAAQNILSKSTKYSLFDPTKEMAYIPLDQEQKVKGKAAIDVVAARFGKSGGSLIQQGLLVVFGSLTLITPYIAGIILFIIGGWLFSVKSLNKQFTELTQEQAEEEKIADAQPATTEASPQPAT